MDIIEIPGLPFPAMPPSARVLLMLAKYAALGVIPMVIPSIVDDPAAADRSRSRSSAAPTTPTSRSLAERGGYVFYLEPGPAPGTSKAYWGPEIRVGEPQPALTANMDAQTNVEQLSLQLRQGEARRSRSSSSRSRSARRRSAFRFPTSRR